MVPCLLWWESIKGFLREDISEVMVLGQHHVLEGLAYLSLLHFLGQPLQWGIHSPNVVFCPLRGDEHGENGKNTQGGNSSVDYPASLEGQSNERGPVLRQLATWLLQVQ